jgi:hypothetical protein
VADWDIMASGKNSFPGPAAMRTSRTVFLALRIASSSLLRIVPDTQTT